jgi:hypothetical protein
VKRRLVSFDLETHQIQPGILAPPIVCGSVAAFGANFDQVHSRLLAKAEALLTARRLLEDESVVIVGANLPFDFGCLAAADPAFLRLIVAAYKSGRVFDILVAKALNDIAAGHLYLQPNGKKLLNAKGRQTKRYSLYICVRDDLGRADAKDNDFWRFRYALLEPLVLPLDPEPFRLWPEEARIYPVDDAVNELRAAAYYLGFPWEAHRSTKDRGGAAFYNLQNLAFQCHVDFALHMGAIWGLRTDQQRIDVVAERADELHAEYVAQFTQAHVDRDGRTWDAVMVEGDAVVLRAREDAGALVRVPTAALDNLDEMAACGLFPAPGKFFRATRPQYLFGGKRFGDKDDKAGTEDTGLVARAVAAAYGASGTCAMCGGRGRYCPPRKAPCRGVKARGRYRGCLGPRCAACDGLGQVRGARTCPTCQGRCYAAEGSGAGPMAAVPCGTCTGAGTVPDVIGPCHACDGAGRCPACGGTQHVTELGAEKQCVDCAATGFGDLALVPRTDGGESGIKRVSTDRDTLTESGDEALMDLGENKHEKARKTYIPWLRGGVDRCLNLDPNVLVESGRTSSKDPVQTFPRSALVAAKSKEQKVPTLRECVRARDGRVLGSSDFPAGELCGFGQVALWTVGFSEMARIINETKDPGNIHTVFGARMIGVKPEELKRRIRDGDKVAKGFRQAAKHWDFGALGGMGPAKLVYTNRKEGAGTTEGANGRKYAGIRFCILVGGKAECGTVKVREWGSKGYEREIPPTCKACLEVATHVIKPLFFETFPEVKEYHQWVKDWLDLHDNVVPCFGPWAANGVDVGRSHRYRKVESFTSGANNGFQAIIADITKDALLRVTDECYIVESSPLYQSVVRVPSFQHDELLTEGEAAAAHVWGPRVGELMKEAYDAWCPDVHIEGVDTALMRYWSKEAEAAYEVLHENVPMHLVEQHLVAACDWKPEKAAKTAAKGGRVVFIADLPAAKQFAGFARGAGGRASEPKLITWEEAKAA